MKMLKNLIFVCVLTAILLYSCEKELTKVYYYSDKRAQSYGLYLDSVGTLISASGHLYFCDTLVLSNNQDTVIDSIRICSIQSFYWLWDIETKRYLKERDITSYFYLKTNKKLATTYIDGYWFDFQAPFEPRCDIITFHLPPERFPYSIMKRDLIYVDTLHDTLLKVYEDKEVVDSLNIERECQYDTIYFLRNFGFWGYAIKDTLWHLNK